VLRVEELASLGDEGAARLLADIHVLQHVLCRLFFELVLASVYDPRRLDDVRHISKGLAFKLHDEQLPENCHNFGRDLARVGRGKHATVKALFNSCIQSGCLEERNS
jgi:hypothetical protein